MCLVSRLHSLHRFDRLPVARADARVKSSWEAGWLALSRIHLVVACAQYSLSPSRRQDARVLDRYSPGGEYDGNEYGGLPVKRITFVYHGVPHHFSYVI
jgi:hypothetical protein